jgi:outer membrane protein
MKTKKFIIVFILVMGLSQVLANPVDKSKEPQLLSLDQCINIALENNHLKPASEYLVKAAQAQYRQALSGHWPQITARSVYSLMDEAPNFIFPSSQMDIPPMELGGFQISLPPFEVPEQDIKLMDQTTVISSLNMTLPLYTGGLVSAYKQQARAGIKVANEDAKRTDLQIILDVKKYYFASVLTQNLYDIGFEALARLEATLQLTENLYKRGSGRVKKTDYLKNKMIVENVRGLVNSIKYKKDLAKAALAFTCGYKNGTLIQPSEAVIPFEPINVELGFLLSDVYQFNPDWQKLNAAIDAFEGKVKQAKSGYLPKLAVMGGINYLNNDYDYGLMTSTNKDGWMVGVGVELPIFSGFRTKNQVAEAKARLSDLAEKKIVFKEGLALQLQNAFSNLKMMGERYESVKSAMDVSIENRDLVERAYQAELMEEKDLIESQIMESLMKVQYENVLYEHYCSRSKLEFIIGKKIVQELK